MASEDEAARAQLAEADQSAARLRRTTTIALAIGLGATVLVALVGTVLLHRRAEDRQAARRYVQATVVEGRGTAPATSELLVRHPGPGTATRESWVRVERFAGYAVGDRLTISFDRVDGSDVRLGGCHCKEPSTLLVLAPVAMALVAAGSLRWSASGRRQARLLADAPPGSVPVTEVRAWWTTAGPSGLNLYVAEPDDGTGDAAGPFLGRVLLAPTYASLVAAGSDLNLLGEPRRNRPVALRCPAGIILPDSRLSADRGDRELPKVTGLWAGAVRRGRVDPAPGAVKRQAGAQAVALALVLPMTYATYLGVTTEARWALIAGLLGVAVHLACRAVAAIPSRDHAPDGAASWWDRDLDRAEPRAEPTRADRWAAITSGGDDRPVGATFGWLGTNLARAPLAVVWTVLSVAMPPVLLLLGAGVATWWVRQPRPVVARYRRPLLPWWLGTATAMAAGAATSTAFVPHGPTAIATRVGCGLAAPALAVLAYRAMAAGLVVGRHHWVVAGLLHTERFSADQVVDVRWEHPPGRPVRRRVEVVLASGEAVVASRLAVPPEAGERLIAWHLAQQEPPPAPPAWALSRPAG